MLVEGLFVLDHPDPLRADDLDQPAEVARQSSLRDGALQPASRTTSRCSATTSSGWRSGRTFYFAGVAVALELVIGFVLAMLVSRCTAIAQALYHHLPGADDDRADRRRLQFLDDLHRQRAAQSDPGSLSRAVRHRSAHPLAFASDRRAVGDHPRRCLAVDVADVPDFPVRLCGAAASARQCGSRDGCNALADVLAGRAAAAQARHRHRGHHPFDGGTEAVRSGGAAHLRRPWHLDADCRLLPVGAGLGVQQVQLRRRGLYSFAAHLLGPDLLRRVHADQPAPGGRRRWRHERRGQSLRPRPRRRASAARAHERRW